MRGLDGARKIGRIVREEMMTRTSRGLLKVVSAHSSEGMTTCRVRKKGLRAHWQAVIWLSS
jgi:hypothetical protein